MDCKTLEFEISDIEWQFLYSTIWETIDSFDDVELIDCGVAKAVVAKPVSKKESNSIHVSVNVFSTVLVVTSDRAKLGQFYIDNIGVKVDIDGKTDALQVEGHIGGVLLHDIRSAASTLYQTILTPKDKTKEMILFSYYSRGKISHTTMSVKEEELGDCDSSFTMQFRKVEIVATVGFILTIKDMVLLPIFARLDLEEAHAKTTMGKDKHPAHTKLSSM